MEKNFRAEDWRERLPIPICEAYPEYTEFYYKAWEIARTHVRDISGMPQNPYMDEGFCDTQVWIWDSCFMAQFCKFGIDVFPGVETLSNFYEVLYGTKKLAKIIPSPDEPFWTHAVQGVENDIYIHIADNPPLFAWGEYENALISGDREHLKELLYEKQYLQRHFEWFDSLKEKSKPQGVFLNTNLIAEDIGYRWEGGSSGMDNTPRGRKQVRDGRERPDNRDMLWLDAICQQALSARLIARMFAILGDCENEALWLEKFKVKRDIVNKFYWDDADKFYYDIDVNTHEFYKVMTVASYWTMTAGIATKEHADYLVAELNNPETLGGDVPLITLARNDGDYCSDGRYWRGSLWLPTAYAALKGMSEYGYHNEAHEAAYKILRHMLATYKNYEPHTIWECYAPEKSEPGKQTREWELCRPDFCGWSALGPISIYIEYVLGFRKINAFDNVIEWEKPSEFEGDIGIKNLHFGDIVTDIIACDNICKVKSSAPYTLKICGKEYAIKTGENEFDIQ